MESLYINQTFLSNIESNNSLDCVFPFWPKKNDEEKDDQEDEVNSKNLYFYEPKPELQNKIKETKENSSNMTSIIQPKKKPKKILFKTTIINKKKKDKKFLAIKRRLKVNKRKTRRKFQEDLIYGKNQISGINSCFCYANCLLKKYGIKQKFLLPMKKFKKFTNYQNFISLNQKKIGDILRFKRSDKNSKYDINHNEMLYNKVINNFPVIKNFFELNYITFFRKYYFIGEKNISLEEYGSNEILTLDDCIITHKKKVQKFKDDENYAQTYENNVRNLYFPNKIKFKVEKS